MVVQLVFSTGEYCDIQRHIFPVDSDSMRDTNATNMQHLRCLFESIPRSTTDSYSFFLLYIIILRFFWVFSFRERPET